MRLYRLRRLQILVRSSAPHRALSSQPRFPMSLRCLLPSCLFAVLLVVASVAAVAAPPSRRTLPSVPAARSDDALSDSVRRIERSTRSQVLSAERVPFDGRNVNRIKSVDDRGRVRVYMDDPQARPASRPGTDTRPKPTPTRGDDD